MPFLKIWVHYVWATKNRTPMLTKKIRTSLFSHIADNARKKEIYIDRINGHVEHVHCLVSLGSDQTVEKVAQLLKGESSYWFNNRSGLGQTKLQWQDDYFAVSISQSGVENVRAYIDGQEEHHRKKTFAQEYEEFVSKYGFHVSG
ncbi:MAG: IS200/IS605 family transposase [Chitinophagaceae bacterium]|nr:MAG: IS200/IS605 family transposase [Chitinophagaceae bacterium]